MSEEKMIKRMSVVVVLLGLFVGSIAVVKRARAADPNPPSRVEVAIAVRLDRDMAHLREAEATIARIRESVKTYDDDALSILTAAKIDPQAFARGDVRVNYATGEITRQAPKVASK